MGEVLSDQAREGFPGLRWESECCGAGFAALPSGDADVTTRSRSPSERELRLAKRLGLRLHERAVSELVTSLGLPAERLELESVGKEEPISSDPDANRRVDIWFLPPG